MTDPGFTMRRGTPTDSRAAYDVFIAAVTDLATRLGTPWDPDREELWTRLEPLYRLLAEHTAEWWLAEDGDGRVIGHARSVERGGLFELAEFFVHPERQAAGVGGSLLERAFPLGRGEVRTIIATTDTRAMSHYYRAGTAAQFPIPALAGAPGTRSGNGPLDPALEAEAPTPDDIPAMRRLERDVLGYDRGDEFSWLLDNRQGYLYRRGGRLVGSAFMGPRGGIGPVAVADAADLPGVLDHLERSAAELELADMTVDVPGPNGAAMRHLLHRGFKMDPFITLLMASRPFGHFDRYIGFSPPFVL
jgi:GNAT superfamily N-acetyltransferase